MSGPRLTASLAIQHLRLVAAVGRHGTLTAAARELNLTQPALSHQLRALETRLRLPLYVRTPRRMVPTPGGERLLELATRVLSEVDAFEAQVQTRGFSDAFGTIRVATECYTAYHWLPEVLRTFGKKWPNVELRIHPEYTASPVAALRDGALDLAVVHQPVTDRRIRLMKLFDDELVLVVHPANPLAARAHVTADDIAAEHLILYSTADGDSAIQRECLRPAGVVPRRLTHIQLTEAIIELVAAGLGVTSLARWAIAPWLRSGAVKAVRITREGLFRTWSAAVRAADPTPAYQHDLLQLLRRLTTDGPQVRAVSVAGTKRRRA